MLKLYILLRFYQNKLDEKSSFICCTEKNAKQLGAYYDCALMEIETKFNVLNRQFSLEQEHNPIETIKTRIKSSESIVEKLQRKNLPMTMESVENNIYDIAGVRVICPFIDDIYLVSNCLLQQDDIKLIEKKDYIKAPKENGYRMQVVKNIIQEN